MGLVGSAPKAIGAMSVFPRMGEIAWEDGVTARLRWEVPKQRGREDRDVAQSAAIGPADRGLLGKTAVGVWIDGLLVANLA